MNFSIFEGWQGSKFWIPPSVDETDGFLKGPPPPPFFSPLVGIINEFLWLLLPSLFSRAA